MAWVAGLGHDDRRHPGSRTLRRPTDAAKELVGWTVWKSREEKSALGNAAAYERKQLQQVERLQNDEVVAEW